MSDEKKIDIKNRWAIDPNTFNKGRNPFGEQPHRERKFNFKIRNSDLVLIDALSEQYGVTRSTLLNYLLMIGLKKQIQPNYADSDNEEVKMLIANRADKKLATTPFQRQASWQEDVLFHKTVNTIDEILEPEEQYVGFSREDIPMEERHSDSFNALKKFFKGIDQNEQ